MSAPVLLGSAQAAVASPFITTAADVPAGHLVLFLFEEANARSVTLTDVTDSDGGNTWVQRYSGVDIGGDSGDLAAWETTMAHLLPAGSTIQGFLDKAPFGGIAAFDLGRFVFDSAGVGAGGFGAISASVTVTDDGERVIGFASNSTLASPDFIDITPSWISQVAYKDNAPAGSATYDVNSRTTVSPDLGTATALSYAPQPLPEPNWIARGLGY